MALKLLLFSPLLHFLLSSHSLAFFFFPFFFGVPNIIRAALIVMDLVSQRGETQTAWKHAAGRSFLGVLFEVSQAAAH